MRNAGSWKIQLLVRSGEGKNAIIWNVIISGFAKNGRVEDAMELFVELISGNIWPDRGTIQSCGPNRLSLQFAEIEGTHDDTQACLLDLKTCCLILVQCYVIPFK
ncbi:pentatricopeptide repeat-containing protein [Striga asiatica]|uniref:Pentatricopeptide repeat-containing protein n=1 Tax=Striga asiatica TaxID=4170 RepID=A0A5A7Q7U8_STRAF|nr:pentatricopeptide repeat-containing protein [Striga asiatica]